MSYHVTRRTLNSEAAQIRALIAETVPTFDIGIVAGPPNADGTVTVSVGGGTPIDATRDPTHPLAQGDRVYVHSQAGSVHVHHRIAGPGE